MTTCSKVMAAALVVIAAAAGVAGAGWQENKSSPTTKDINAIKMVSPTNGWAVGYWGEILHYDGTKWYIYYTWPVLYLQDVDFSAANFGFAVGDAGAGAFFDGATWTSRAIPTSQALYAIGIPLGQTTTVWAAGENGELWRWSGGAWANVPLGTNRALHDIYWSSATDGWLCGNYGTVYHYTGSSWQAMNAATSTTFYCIYALSPTNVWVGGAGGQLYHYEGFGWAQVATPTTNAIREMAFNNATDGWAVCDNGTVIQYDGVDWKTVPISPPTGENFSGMNMLDATSGWAVGTKGIIYAYRNYPGVEPMSLGRVKAMLK